MKRSSRYPSVAAARCRGITLSLISLGLLGTTSAAVATWDGSVDNNWSTTGNWDTDASPVGQDVSFGDVDKTGSTTVNSIVDVDTTLSSLSFVNTGNSGTTDWQVVQIGAAQTLTLNGSGITGGNVLFLGSTNAALTGKQYTYAKMTGGGSLVINASDDNVLITQVSSNDSGTARLDLSGLSSFSANVANFYVGQGKRMTSTLLLASTEAGTNTITASKLAVGDSNGSDPGGVSLLSLGTANTLNVDDIFVAASASDVAQVQRASGTISFQNAGSSVTIRGATGGTSRADLSIALMEYIPGQVTNTHARGTVDFTGSTVDALLGEVKMGFSNAFSTGGATGTLSMDAGTIDATSVLLGYNEYRSQDSTNGSNGILNVSGGTFTAGAMSLGDNIGTGNLTDTQRAGAATGTVNILGTGAVNVTGDITMGTRTGGSTGVQATVNITGGSLTVGGNMTENAANEPLAVVGSTVNLNGGTLDMTGGTIKVDTFTVESGTLKNLGQFNSGDTIGANLVKTGSGTLNIEGDNTFTGATMINAGTVSLFTAGTNNIANSSAIIVADGATFDVTGVAGGFSLAAGQILSGNGTIIGDMLFETGAGFAFSLTETLTVSTGTVSFDGFGITDVAGLDSETIGGTYNLIVGSVNSANISNIGLENAYDLGGGKLAYFEIGSLNLIVVPVAIPEPSALALLMGGSVLLLVGGRRRRQLSL